MALADELVDVKSEVNDILREVFEFEGARLFLLRRGGETARFSVVEEVLAGWRARFNDFRGQMSLTIATDDAEFTDKIAQTSHFAYGVPVVVGAEQEMDVFRIDPDGADVFPPSDRSYSWRLFGVKVLDERFVVPSDGGDTEWVVQRTIEGATLTLALGDPIVGVFGGNFTDADLERRLVIEDAIDGVIIAINSENEVTLNANATNTPFFGTVTIYEAA